MLYAHTAVIAAAFGRAEVVVGWNTGRLLLFWGIEITSTPAEGVLPPDQGSEATGQTLTLHSLPRTYCAPRQFQRTFVDDQRDTQQP